MGSDQGEEGKENGQAQIKTPASKLMQERLGPLRPPSLLHLFRRLKAVPAFPIYHQTRRPFYCHRRRFKQYCCAHATSTAAKFRLQERQPAKNTKHINTLKISRIGSELKGRYSRFSPRRRLNPMLSCLMSNASHPPNIGILETRNIGEGAP